MAHSKKYRRKSRRPEGYGTKSETSKANGNKIDRLIYRENSLSEQAIANYENLEFIIRSKVRQ